MTKRRLLIALLLSIAGILLFLFLKPCSTEPATTALGGAPPHAQAVSPKKALAPEKKPAQLAEEAPPIAPPPAQVDNAPPVELKAGDELPDVAKCVSTRFPAEAKPHVQSATVTVRLVVDKFGNVRSVKTTAVDFDQGPADDLLPMLRKAFIQAGNRAFGAKKCPPHIVNGQAVGYAIEVPLRYKH